MTVIAGQRADHYRTPDELAGFLPRVLSAPKDLGTLDLVVRRPGRGVREVLDEGELSVSHGLVGDNWIERVTDGPDGPNPDDQLNVMNSRLVEFLAGDPELRQLAGDQLYLDLDLSAENLPAGTRLVIGDPDVRGAVIEVTALPHTGCQQLWSDFGASAMRFVNEKIGRPLRLRGLCAKVVSPGLVRPGDAVRVERST